MSDGGWTASSGAWEEFVDLGDPNRTHLLDPLMLELCAPLAGARVLDLGCGEGRFARMMSARGAAVVGLDPTRALLCSAQRRNSGPLVRGRGESLPFADEAFDLVASYVTLVDIEEYRGAILESSRVLRPNGVFVLSNVSAFATANGRWIHDGQGRKERYSFDRYSEEFAESCSWRGIEVLQYHRPLGMVMSACLDAGLRLTHFSEPLPSKDAMAKHPGLADFVRMPNFTVMAWRKEAG